MPDDRYASLLTDAVGDIGARVGVAGVNLRTRDRFELRADDSFPTASMIKLPILVELYRRADAGDLALERRVDLLESDTSKGSGVLNSLAPGLTPTVRDLAYLMMSISDNTATNALIRLLGVGAVNDTMRREGIEDVELRNPIDIVSLRTDPGHLGVGTPRAFAQLMERVYRRSIVNPAACEDMLALMRDVGPDRIPRYLPYNPSSDDYVPLGLLPPGPWVKVAGKTGTLRGIAGHVAVVWSDDVELVLAVMCAESSDTRATADHELVTAIGRVGKAVYEACVP